MSFFRILDLPNEFLYYTLELCDPDDFEASALVCKRLHEVATPLIPNHNLCRRIASDAKLEVVPATGHIVIRKPSEFLLWVTDQPTKVQIEVFRYFKRVVLFPAKPVEQSQLEIVEKRLERFPALNQAVLCAQVGLKGAHYRDHEIALLRLFSHVESLILPHANAWINYKRPYSQMPGVPELASRAQGIAQFQHLRELYVHGTLNESHHATIAPLLGLPRLETLVVGEFDQQENGLWERSGLTRNEISYEGYRELRTNRDIVLHELADGKGPLESTLKSTELSADEVHSNIYGDGCSGLKNLVIFRGWWDSENMGKLLRHLPLLRTLIWENYMPRQVTQGNTRPEVFAKKLFNPLGLLQQLSTTHGDKLEHLAVFIRNEGGDTLILRDQAVIHFKDFPRLKHLEFDTRLLRLGEDWGSLPPSMTEILPHSLQNLGLILHDPDPRITDALLVAPACTSDALLFAEFPSLRKIVLSLSYEASIRIEDHQFFGLKRRFATSNILLERECLDVRKEFMPTLDWDGHTNFLDQIPPHFYD